MIGIANALRDVAGSLNVLADEIDGDAAAQAAITIAKGPRPSLGGEAEAVGQYQELSTFDPVNHPGRFA